VGIIKGQLWEGIVSLFQEACQEGYDGRNDDAGADTATMVQRTLADAYLVVETFGPKLRERFIADFVKDHQREYKEL
jgi:hypothetical protein